jgi:hypothetical protein
MVFLLFVMLGGMFIRVDLLLRLEAAFVLAVALIGYAGLHGSWLYFALLFFVPDVSLLGYMAKGNGRLAASFYNVVHCYALPLAAGLIAWRFGSVLGERLAIIWVAHIAFDRFVGAGLKYAQGFKPTHIQAVRFYRAL